MACTEYRWDDIKGHLDLIRPRSFTHKEDGNGELYFEIRKRVFKGPWITCECWIAREDVPAAFAATFPEHEREGREASMSGALL